MRIKAKDLARTLLALRDAEQASKLWEDAANDQADTIAELSATIRAQAEANRGLALKVAELEANPIVWTPPNPTNQSQSGDAVEVQQP